MLDFSGQVQLYRQLYDILFQDIVGGVYAIGECIPSESELMAQYGVSRSTARKAMEMLSSNGMISKRQGIGSEVVANRPNFALSHATSIVKRNDDDRGAAKKHLLDAKIILASDEVCRALRLSEDTEIYCLRRVRYAGDRPYYLEVNYYERAFLPHAMERDFSKESLRSYMSDELGVKWSRASQEVHSVIADVKLADLLMIAEGDPLLYTTRISYDVANQPREFVKTYYRADLYHLEVELRAE